MKYAMGIFQGLIILLGCIQFYSCHSHSPKRPHIVLMVADDLGWNDVSFHGSKQIPTPNIDGMARDGIILNQYYVQPTCSPSRGSLMTGKYPIQIGFQQDLILNSQPWGLPLKEKILPQYLKEMNYSTHAVGKWHLGFFNEVYLPLYRGFDSFFGYYNGVEDYYNHFSEDISVNVTGLDLHINRFNSHSVVSDYNGTYGTDLFTDKAKKIIQNHNPVEPLFLYFAQQAPHGGNFDNPLQAPREYVDRMVGIDDEKRKIFAGMVSAMDHSVGEIIYALSKSGMLEDTIFIFTTDNGGAPQETDGTSGSNWPLKGCKYNLWEGGVRGVAFIWSTALRQHSRIHNELMHISDWLPTLLSAAGGQDALKSLPADLDGVDQWPSISCDLPSPRTEILLNIDEHNKVEGIRKGRFKLLKGSYFNGEFDKWYDSEGRVYNSSDSDQTPEMEHLYARNYKRFSRHAKALRVLWGLYHKHRWMAEACTTHVCKEQLEVKCGMPRPNVSNCDPQKETCLFDIVSDPCEFNNIAQQSPEIKEELERAIDKYRPLIVPPGGKPSDPRSYPMLHDNAWVPWIPDATPGE